MLKALQQDKLREIMDLADKILAKWDPNSLGHTLEELREMEPDPDNVLLYEKIAALSHEARLELMALMWVGRDGVSFANALAYARKHSNEHDAHYITEKTMGLSVYLHKATKTFGGDSDAVH
jgi:hypothetical protein